MANTIKFKRASGSDPSASDLAIGEPGLRTDTAELFFKKDDGTVAKVSGGGGGPNFKYLELRNAANNGAASFPGNDFTLVTAGTTTAISPSAANTLLVSVSGVIQKPNSGTSTSGITGFIIDGSRFKTATNLPAAPDFIVFQESGGIGEPSDNTVTSAKIVDGAIVNADINASAAIAGTKISPDFGSQAITTTGSITANNINANSGLDISITSGTVSAIFPNNTQVNGITGMPSQAGTPFVVGKDTGSNRSAIFAGNVATGNLDVTGAITGTGDLTIDTTTLHVDSSNNRVGIGTASVNKLLHVKGDDANGTQVLVQAASGTNSAGMQFDPASGDTFEYQAAASGLFVAYNRTDNRADLFVDGAGNIGIGNNSPSSLLHLINSSNFGIRLTKSGSSDAEIKNTNSLDLCCSSGGSAGQVIRMLTGGGTGSLVERLRVNGNGKLLVGMSSTLISSPNNPRLQVFQQMGIRAETNNNSSTALIFQNPAGRQGFINTNASGITIVGTSDYRVKEDINYTIDAIPIIKQVKPCTFKFKADQENLTVHGFIAHELQAVLPEAVTGEKDEVVTQAKIDSGEYEQETLGNEIHQGVDAGKLIPLLTKALQEAIARIEALEAK